MNAILHPNRFGGGYLFRHHFVNELGGRLARLYRLLENKRN
jgi:hypothetical protein